MKEDIKLQKAIELLKEAVKFINKMPNTRYGERLSYSLAFEIDEFLEKELK